MTRSWPDRNWSKPKTSARVFRASGRLGMRRVSGRSIGHLLFVGPADISQVMGVPGDFENPKCLDAIEGIARACASAGKPWGIVPRGPEYAERMLGWGCRMFVLGFDIHVVHAGIRATKSRYGSFFEQPA